MHAERVIRRTLILVSGMAIVIHPGSALAISPETSAPIAPHPGAPASFADLAEDLSPSVVNISTRQRVEVPIFNPFAGSPFEDFFGAPQRMRTREAQSLGSGFIISSDGYVVTNNHVISPPGQQGEVMSITVTLADGREYAASVSGSDAASDLAVLKLDTDSPLPFVSFGNSQRAEVGDWILAIGNPFGLGGTVTSGIISAVYRNTGSGTAYDRYIQTDASINRGNSGGPMFNMRGEVIGINNAIFSPTGGSVGIGFAIPSNTAAPIIEKLKLGEEIERGYLGVRIQRLSDDLADSLGLVRNRGEFVQAVEPGGAAAEAGIQAGDVILEVNGEEVRPDQTLAYLVANIDPGEDVLIDLIRKGRRIKMEVTLGERPSEKQLARGSFGAAGEADPDEFGKSEERRDDSLSEKTLGLSVVPLTPRIAQQLGANPSLEALVIDAVAPGSDAARKGLRRGDIVLSANYRETQNLAALESALRQARDEGREALLLRVQPRGGVARFVAVRLSDLPIDDR